jgi:hypothetical protein
MLGIIVNGEGEKSTGYVASISVPNIYLYVTRSLAVKDTGF